MVRQANVALRVRQPRSLLSGLLAFKRWKPRWRRSKPKGDRLMDDDYYAYDFPPAKHPGREAFTMTLAFGCIVGFVIWAAWKLL